MSKIAKIFCLAPVMLLLMLAQSTEAQTMIRLEAQMEGKAEAKAHARFIKRGTRMKFNVEVEEDTPVRGGTVYSVFVLRREKQIVFEGFIKTDDFGFGEIDLDTREGDRVSQLRVGDIVAISAANGASLTGVMRSTR